MKKIFDGERVDIEIRPLAPGTRNRLVVIVAANTVTDVSADGTNVALTQLAQLHYEVGEAINALMAKRAAIDEAGKMT